MQGAKRVPHPAVIINRFKKSVVCTLDLSGPDYLLRLSLLLDTPMPPRQRVPLPAHPQATPPVSEGDARVFQLNRTKKLQDIKQTVARLQ